MLNIYGAVIRNDWKVFKMIDFKVQIPLDLVYLKKAVASIWQDFISKGYGR